MSTTTKICDCELGHNGLGMAIRECDCEDRKAAMAESLTSRNPLLIFADQWALDGDCLRCRDCDRSQHASRATEDFVHRSDCDARAFAVPAPWMTLGGLITAQIARAERNTDA